ncbi:hypothetical protein BDN72DRAFT_845417 [Pluteus cervinus]|uniref:Uncharacterized protein n=1 Tax=Pluteus cervinus TaxID=181527 RepID=A0ACD3AI50_9AGAR|nr:hypothetical protein BDN72DRAFT_845417 [Pluteus cervinus]
MVYVPTRGLKRPISPDAQRAKKKPKHSTPPNSPSASTGGDLEALVLGLNDEIRALKEEREQDKKEREKEKKEREKEKKLREKDSQRISYLELKWGSIAGPISARALLDSLQAEIVHSYYSQDEHAIDGPDGVDPAVVRVMSDEDKFNPYSRAMKPLIKRVKDILSSGGWESESLLLELKRLALLKNNQCGDAPFSCIFGPHSIRGQLNGAAHSLDEYGVLRYIFEFAPRSIRNDLSILYEMRFGEDATYAAQQRGIRTW